MILIEEVPAQNVVVLNNVPIYDCYKIVTQNNHDISIIAEGLEINELFIDIYCNSDSTFYYGAILTEIVNMTVTIDYPIETDTIKIYGVDDVNIS